MKLTTFTDYSLRVLIYLAADPERRATIAEIAKSFDISEAHLMKVVHTLGRLGLVATIRGKGGARSEQRNRSPASSWCRAVPGISPRHGTTSANAASTRLKPGPAICWRGRRGLGTSG